MNLNVTQSDWQEALSRCLVSPPPPISANCVLAVALQRATGDAEAWAGWSILRTQGHTYRPLSQLAMQDITVAFDAAIDGKPFIHPDLPVTLELIADADWGAPL